MAATNSHGCSWGYAILLSRFILLILDSGIVKSFGVLIPMLVQRYESDYANMGLICSMPATLVYLFFPFVTLLLKKYTNRSVAMTGGVLSGFCVLACAFIKSTAALGVCLALSGVGLSMAFVPAVIAVNEFFPQNFVFMNTLALYGYTVGSMFLPIITDRAIHAYGLTGAFVILGGLSFNIVACGATLRKAPRNVVPFKNGRNQNDEDEEGECLIKGKVSQQNKETIHREENANKGDEGTMEQRHSRCSGESKTKQPSVSMGPQRKNGYPKATGMVNQGHLIQGKDPGSYEFDLQGENGHVETEVYKAEQRCLIQSETQSDTSCMCELSSKTSLWNWVHSWGILKEPLFLFSLPIHLLIGYTTYSWMLFLVPHAEHLGIPVSRAVFLSTIGGIGGVIGRTIFIILISKGINVFPVYITVGIICTTSFLLDFISSAYEVRAVLAFLQGFCFFIEDTVLTTVCKTMVVDEKNFSPAFTIGGFLLGVGVTCSGYFTGYLFDVTQSFTKVFIIIGSIHAVVVVHISFLTILAKKRKIVC